MRLRHQRGLLDRKAKAGPGIEPCPDFLVPYREVGKLLRILDDTNRHCLSDPPVIFHKCQETKMIYELAIQMEELRAELRDAENAAERRQIQAELESAQAERIVAGAKLDGLAESEPAF